MEEDYVNLVLARHDRLKTMIPPEDAPFQSLPSQTLRDVLPSSPPPPPPPLQPSLSSHEPSSSLVVSLNSFFNASPVLDKLLCGAGSSLTSGSDDSALSKPTLLHLDPFSEGDASDIDAAMFHPSGGAVTVELRSVGPLIRLNHECDPYVTCALYGRDGTRRGEVTQWPRRHDTTNPAWSSASRFVGPAGYICRPGDYLEFGILQGSWTTGGEVVGVARMTDVFRVVPLDNDTEERDAEVSPSSVVSSGGSERLGDDNGYHSPSHHPTEK